MYLLNRITGFLIMISIQVLFNEESLSQSVIVLFLMCTQLLVLLLNQFVNPKWPLLYYFEKLWRCTF